MKSSYIYLNLHKIHLKWYTQNKWNDLSTINLHVVTPVIGIYYGNESDEYVIFLIFFVTSSI